MNNNIEERRYYEKYNSYGYEYDYLGGWVNKLDKVDTSLTN